MTIQKKELKRERQIHQNFRKNSGGQALVELLVGLGVGAIILGSAVGITRVVIRSNDDVKKGQTATELARELIDDVRVAADYDWKTFYELSKGADNHYHVNATSTPFTFASGDESITQNGVDFTRYLYVNNVERDGNNAVVASSGTNDPATQEIIVTVTWSGGTGITLSEYISRYRNFVFRQSDWSGGDNESGVLTVSKSTYASSTGVATSTAGEIKLNGF